MRKTILESDVGSTNVSQTLFAVFKEGVYRHECGGIFSTIDLAESAAETMIAGERDAWHSYDVLPFILDVRTSQTPVTSVRHEPSDKTYRTGGELIEPKALVSWSRDRTGAITKTKGEST